MKECACIFALRVLFCLHLGIVMTVRSEVKDDLQFEQESGENRQHTATSNTNTTRLLQFSKIIAGY